MKKGKKEKGIKVYIPLIVVIAIVLCGGWYWYSEYTNMYLQMIAHIDSDNYAIRLKNSGTYQSHFISKRR